MKISISRVSVMESPVNISNLGSSAWFIPWNTFLHDSDFILFYHKIHKYRKPTQNKLYCNTVTLRHFWCYFSQFSMSHPITFFGYSEQCLIDAIILLISVITYVSSIQSDYISRAFRTIVCIYVNSSITSNYNLSR